MARYSDRSDLYGPGEQPPYEDPQWNVGPGRVVTPPRKKLPVWPWIVLAAVAVLACGVMIPVLASMNDNAEKTVEALNTPTTIEPSVKGKAGTPKTMNPPQAIGEGEWLVGEDVKAGRYKTKGAEDSLFTFCAWTVYDKEDGDAIDFGTSDNEKAPGRVTLKKGNAFHTNGCKPWTLQER